jgi:hypothetical protein
MTAFSPGQSPPPVRTPTFTVALCPFWRVAAPERSTLDPLTVGQTCEFTA